MAKNFRHIRSVYFIGIASVILALNGGIAEAFDSALDTAKQSSRWEFDGSYIYANSLQDIEELTPLLKQSSGSILTRQPGQDKKQGVWFTKFTPDGNNRWNMSNSLSHLLYVQGWVVYLAHPSVPLVITSSKGDVGRFWSDGKSWCDAVFNMDFSNMFKAEITTNGTGEYAMVDKIVLGIMGNVSALKKRSLNPCLNQTILTMGVPKPDMEVETTTEQGLSDLEDKNKSSTSTSPQSPKPTESSVRTYQTEKGGAKCNCICTCAKPVATSNFNSSATTPAPGNPLLI